MYEASFSDIYNKFGWNTYAEVISEQLLEWININNLNIQTALDLGCGTGILCAALADAGIDTVGVDLSEHMLRHARENCQSVEFICADMTRYDPGRCFDLVTSTGDAINHILKTEDVRLVFANVHDHLSPGGVFVFDVMAYSDLHDGDTFDMNDDLVTARFNIERTDRSLISMHIAVADENNNVNAETVTEMIHDLSELQRMLEETGFRNVQMTPELLPNKKHPAGAMFFIAHV